MEQSPDEPAGHRHPAHGHRVDPHGGGRLRRALAPEHPRTRRSDERTGATVVAVVRDGEPITEFDPARFEVATGDAVIVAGSDEHVRQFETEFGM